MEHWIAWPWPPTDGADAHWWALRFTPRVARLDEALLLEVSTTERLWGGRPRLLALMRQEAEDAVHAQAPTVLQALALLRLAQAGRQPPRHVPQGLPLHTLAALRPHAASLARMGCRTWGDVRALPRAGLARRLGAQPLRALDQAWGDAPHPLPWLTCPERFETSAELPALVDTADGLLHPAQPLLAALRRWLQARQQGVLGLELGWRYALRRIDGVDLPPGDTLAVRTAEPLQDMAHLHRLLAEHLAHRRLAAPVGHVTLRALETAPWREDSGVLAPQGHSGQGEPWGQFVERLSARLGAGQVLVPQLLADHRPERMVQWRAAADGPATPPAALVSRHRSDVEGCAPPSDRSARRIGQPIPGVLASDATPRCDARASADRQMTGDATLVPDAALYPAWLVRPPRPLPVRGGRPCWQGPLRLLAGPQRLETGWWEAPGAEAGLARRDYFVAHNAAAGTVWVFRERSKQGELWFLQGFYG